MRWLTFIAITLSLASALRANEATAVDHSEYDANGKPWFQKYFDENRVDEITGYKPPKNWRFSDDVEFLDLQVSRNLPSSYDIRKLHPSGHLQPIKRQRCGDCWAHSVIATVESDWMLKHPQEPAPEIYAQQELISCRNTGGSCHGGYFTAFDYITGKNGPGLPLEKDLPYQGHGTACNHSVTKKPRATRWFYIGNRFDERGASIAQMKQALMDYGSLSVDVHAFSFTGSGIYTHCGGGGTNHMVNIEGWVDFDEADKKKYGSDGYWIMRNSWGESFGDHGYAKVLFTSKGGRKCNNLGQTTAVAIVD